MMLGSVFLDVAVIRHDRTILQLRDNVCFPKARFRRRSTHVPNLTDELSTAKERRLNQFGTAVLV